MLRLEKVNGKNVWDILKLKVSDSQKDFVARNDISIIEAYTAITGNGYAFPFGIYEEDTPVGFLMIGYDTDDYWDDAPEIAKGNYNLWRLMIDEKYQGKGYGREAVRLALVFINTFPCGKADYCWLSYEPKNDAARKLYSSFGFNATGEYDGEEVIAVLKLAENPGMNHADKYQDVLTADFSDMLFQNAFKQYFSELGIQVTDWDGLFQEMNEEGGNEAYIRTAADGNIIGFIMFKPVPFSSWFFEETGGFVREFWIAEAYRSQGNGADLLKLAEDRLAARDIHMILLTTDTAEQFYLRHGFQKAPGMKAKNEDPVYIKRI